MILSRAVVGGGSDPRGSRADEDELSAGLGGGEELGFAEEGGDGEQREADDP